jgi:hypothetical protein
VSKATARVLEQTHINVPERVELRGNAEVAHAR